jgi:hypothetical protein
MRKKQSRTSIHTRTSRGERRLMMMNSLVTTVFLLLFSSSLSSLVHILITMNKHHLAVHLYLLRSFSHLVRWTKTLLLFFDGDTHTNAGIEFISPLSPRLTVGHQRHECHLTRCDTLTYYKSLLNSNECFLQCTQACLSLTLSSRAGDEHWYCADRTKESYL